MSHATDLVTLPDVPRLTLANLTAPACLVGAPGSLAPLDRTLPDHAELDDLMEAG